MINIISIGEILWDIFPDKKILGGAPANFVFHARQFGSDATLFTALGNDQQGIELEENAVKAGIIMQSSIVSHPTGIADIFLNKWSPLEIIPIFPEELAPHTLKYLSIP